MLDPDSPPEGATPIEIPHVEPDPDAPPEPATPTGTPDTDAPVTGGMPIPMLDSTVDIQPTGGMPIPMPDIADPTAGIDFQPIDPSEDEGLSVEPEVGIGREVGTEALAGDIRRSVEFAAEEQAADEDPEEDPVQP
jgi:hypothetical protein